VSNTFDTFARRRPAAVRRLLTAAHLYVLTLPAVTVLVVLTGHTLLAVLGVLALIGLYGTGYATAAYRSRVQVAQARRDPLTAGVAWPPAPGDDLIPLLLSVADTHTLYQGLRDARDLWTKSAAAQDGAPRTALHPDATPGTGDATSGVSAAAHAARYARLVEHLTPIIDATPAGAHTGAATAQPSVASVVLVGISAEFTPLDVEALVKTAAEAVCGQREDLSSRQLDLAARAYALLQEDIDG
jgi:hypothetical protein